MTYLKTKLSHWTADFASFAASTPRSDWVVAGTPGVLVVVFAAAALVL